MDNFYQDSLFEINLAEVSPRQDREIRIPPTDLSAGAQIRVVRNARRKRSISAYREHGAIVIQVPTHLTRSQVSEAIPEMVARVIAGEEREKITDGQLLNRAEKLLARYLPEFSLTPISVRWKPMRERWGSCTTAERTIRISDRLNGAPEYVIDYLLVHELIHLEVSDHGERFQRLLARFEGSERANAYLEGYEAGARG